MKTRQIKEAIHNHCENIIRYAQDKHTNLLVNAFESDSKKWISFDAEEISPDALISNPGKQQNFFRTLVGLSHIMHNDNFKDIAKTIFSFIFNNLTDKNGLIYWGGHLGFDLSKNELAYTNQKKIVHELKIDYPFYEIMWETNPFKTQSYIEAFWNAHIHNWCNLNFNRHGQYNKPLGNIWDNKYFDNEVFFWDEKNLTFVTAGSNLYYAASMLAHFTGNEKPLLWSKALAHRYVETRQKPIDISGYQYNQSKTSWCDGRSVRGDRAQYQYAPYIPDRHLVYEGTIFKPIPAVQRCQLFLSDLLKDKGIEFYDWSIEEIKAWAKNAYREKDNSFIPMLTDGYSLEGFVFQNNGYYGTKGQIIGPIFADANFFWLYCMATRKCQDEFLWQTTRNIAKGNGLGDIGNSNGDNICLNREFQGSNYQLIYGFLELYTKSKKTEFLIFAYEMGLRLIKTTYKQGLFVSDNNIIEINNPTPLALLNVLAFLEGESSILSKTFV